ncbi:cipC-like antibiotic response protein [Aspergillus flavus AF70]|nr:cipC-like antibiotic response protein [Aspergillus flavus AF70]
MPFGWGDAENAHQQVQEGQHEGHLSHDLIAGAAAFTGMKAWEDHQRKEGKEVSHSTAKQVIAGLAAAGVTRLVETKGLNAIDEHKAKKQAEENAQRLYEEHYERGQNAPHFNPNEHKPHPSFERNRFDEHPHHEGRPEHRPQGDQVDRW